MYVHYEFASVGVWVQKNCKEQEAVADVVMCVCACKGKKVVSGRNKWNAGEFPGETI